MTINEIHAKYASEYPEQNFKSNYRNLVNALVKKGLVINKDALGVYHNQVKQSTNHRKEEGKLPPWRSSEAKQTLINELAKPASKIHDMSPMQVHAQYASQYPVNNFKNNYQNLLKVLMEEGLIPEETENPKVKWQHSMGRRLLYKMFMNKEVFEKAKTMTVHQLWLSHSFFREYKFSKFGEYYDTMTELSTSRKENIKVRELIHTFICRNFV